MARYLYYTMYQSGGSGLSNLVMSAEIGVVLAHLTNRLLVLAGNVPPPANLVAYDTRVNPRATSRVTDLFDMPVAWVDPQEVDLAGIESLELTKLSLGDFAFYFPRTLDLAGSDARSFARDRNHWVSVAGEHDRVPLLRLSEDPIVPGTNDHRANLSFYGYQFYLDAEARRSVYRLLSGMQPKRPFAELAQRVARDLGPFNAVHLRRGDFKHTYGVTTLDRKPYEALEVMDQLFGRKEPLVILTDERDDPFFQEIKLSYPQHCFIDWHILDHYGAEFARLPHTDSVSLAHLSQLVAAESKEFIGTMTSTFTALIQRYRGNRGKREVFRYLWNELPEKNEKLERGRHAISQCVPLDRGQMIEQFTGPYSWNRVSQLLNPTWMREWPESFLLPEVLATGALVAPPAASAAPVSRSLATATIAAQQAVLHASFEQLQVGIWSSDAALLRQLGPELGAELNGPVGNVITNLELSATGTGYTIEQRGASDKIACDKEQLPHALKRKVASLFAAARHRYAWLEAAAYAKGGQGILVAGDTGDPEDLFRTTMRTLGWELIDGGFIAVRSRDRMIVPIGARQRPEGAGARPKASRASVPLSGIVITMKAPLHARAAALLPQSAAAAVAALIRESLDFHIDQHRAVTALCQVVEGRAAALVQYGRPKEGAQAIAGWADAIATVPAAAAELPGQISEVSGQVSGPDARPKAAL